MEVMRVINKGHLLGLLGLLGAFIWVLLRGLLRLFTRVIRLLGLFVSVIGVIIRVIRDVC